MLQKINQVTRGWIAGIVLSLVAVTFVFWGISNYEHTTVDTTVVEVNGESISAQAYKQVLDQLRQQVAARMGDDFQLTPEIDNQLKKEALDAIIKQTVLKQAALKSGYYVSMAQAQQILAQIPAFQENGKFSKVRFGQILMNLQLSERDFLEKLQSDILIDEVRTGIVNTAFVLPSEIDDVIKLTEQTRTIRYLIIPEDKFKNEITITDNQIKDYYQSHKDSFKSKEKVSIDYLQLSLAELQEQVKLSAQQISDYYQSHLNNFKTQPEWQVAHILVKVPSDATEKQVTEAKQKSEKIAAELAKGADFATLAKQNSDDVLTASQGGVLPWFTSGTFDTQFETTVMTLKQNGEVSKPTKTKYGFDIIKLIDQKKSQQISLADATSKIETLLKQQTAQQQFADLSDQLSNLTYANPDSLVQASNSLKLPIKSSGLFSKEGEKQGILANKKVVNAAFSDDVLLQGNNSEAIQVDNTILLVLHVNHHEPSAYMPVEKVQNTIRDKLIQQQELAKAKSLAEQIQQNLKQGGDTTALETKNQLKWITENNIKRQQPKLDKPIVAAAFQLPPLVNIPSSNVIAVKSGYALVQLQNVTPGDVKSVTSEQRKGYQQQLQSALGETNYDFYVNSLMQQAKIKHKTLV